MKVPSISVREKHNIILHSIDPTKVGDLFGTDTGKGGWYPGEDSAMML